VLLGSLLLRIFNLARRVEGFGMRHFYPEGTPDGVSSTSSAVIRLIREIRGTIKDPPPWNQ